MVGLLVLLIAVSTIHFGFKRHLFPKARFRAWWMMVLIFALASVLDSRISLLGMALLSALALREFLRTTSSTSTKFLCALALVTQYYFVYTNWYGMFVIFIPVYVFLCLPAAHAGKDKDVFHDVASVHWGLMITVFCLSHAAYILMLPDGPALLFFATVLTEFSDASRILTSRWKKVAPIAAVLASTTAALVFGPSFTPMSEPHVLLAGVVLGIAAVLGNESLQRVGKELGFARGGAMERIESLAYTAPLFLHGFRYLYT